MENFYATLSLNNFVSIEEVKIHRRKLAKIYHPDKNAEELDTATLLMSKANNAYDIIGKSEKTKAEYDAQLKIYLAQPQRLQSENDRLSSKANEQAQLAKYASEQADNYKKLAGFAGLFSLAVLIWVLSQTNKKN